LNFTDEITYHDLANLISFLTQWRIKMTAAVAVKPEVKEVEAPKAVAPQVPTAPKLKAVKPAAPSVK
jgi:hypothetical protein